MTDVRISELAGNQSMLTSATNISYPKKVKIPVTMTLIFTKSN